MSPTREPEAPPEYRVYRSRPRLLSRGPREGESMLDDLRGRGPRRRDRGDRSRPRITPGRVVAALVAAVVGWLLLAVVVFLVSSLVHGDGANSATEAALNKGGPGLFSPTTTLVLGSDQRTKGTKEPGASTSGPSRADSILLLRTGGGKSAKLSIPRDTVVDIPGHGRNKINAAFAIGGAPLMIRTVRRYLGIEINHVVLVDFASFPSLIDAMGGINVKTGCVVSLINGGRRNGGTTLRLKAGDNHLTGKQALALARTRENRCNPAENDLTRARRQQQIVSAMKSRVLSPAGFVRAPLIAWQAPKTLRGDMNGPTLVLYALGTALSGNAPTRVLKPSGGETLPDGGAGLVVSEAEKRSEVRRFEQG
jgi:LCP family protein required for cell wall assembly